MGDPATNSSCQLLFPQVRRTSAGNVALQEVRWCYTPAATAVPDAWVRRFSGRAGR